MKLFMKLLPALVVSVCAACNEPGNDSGKPDPVLPDEITYTYDEEVVHNPERGWYVYNAFKFQNGTISRAALTESTVNSHVERGITIVHTIYHMYDFVDKPLSQELLDMFEANMNAIRAGGAKCLLRFSYSETYDSANERPIENSDAPFEVFSGHIAQLKPLIQKHSDVLYVMEAGFIGAWGEWYYTSHYNYRPQTAEDYAPRRALMDKLLDAVPKKRMICVRYPTAKLMMYDLTIADSVTVSTAFNESDLSRIAMHNDCFVANANDMGTFGSREYWNRESRYLIMGGETCQRSTFSRCDNTVKQMENMHFSYLNKDYNTSVISGWRTEDCYDEIDRRLGYRLSLTTASFSGQPSVDQPFEVALNILSDGFAGPMNPRDAEIVFVEKGSSSAPVRMKLDDDPRFWFAGQTHRVDASLDISSLSAGKTYEVFLNLPDPEPTLNTRPEYSIRLANVGVWDENTGYNKLHEITVQ